MGFDITGLEDKHLAGGALAKILGAVVIPAKAWSKHVGKLGKVTGAKTCKAYEAALGWALPAEAEEWFDLEGSKGLPESYDSGWYCSALDVEVPAKGKASKALAASPMLLFAGLARIGQDASGDSMYVSLLPHPLGVAQPALFNHENGELEESGAESIADLFVDKWVSDDDDDDERPGALGAKRYRAVAAARKAFHARVKKALAKRERWADPLELFARVKWMLGLLHGEPAYRFAQELAKAPSFATWNQEKQAAAKHPHLALYWMLAHALFGNDDACREAATLASKCKGYVAPELAATVLAFCNGKKSSPIDKLSGEAFAKARDLVAKNALPEQLANRPKPSPLDEEVRAHDKALEALAKSDPEKAELVKEYFRERGDEAYNHWPYQTTVPDWIVPAAAAAFRAGLVVDLGHPKAYAGVSRALADRADHPDARAALIATLTTLAPDDDRLGHAVQALIGRDEPESREAVRAAAWRWLSVARGIDDVLAKRQQRFTLDDMVAKDDKLQPVVHAVLQRADDEAEKLTLAISEAKLSFRVLKRTAGLMFRVYGLRNLTDRYDRMETFLGLLDEVPGSKDPDEPGVALDTTACVAMAEASLALARMDAPRAKPRLEAFLSKERRTHHRAAGVAGCVIPGLLFIDPTHERALYWLERVLAIRGSEPWIYGGLVAAREAKIAQAVPWVLPHAYDTQVNSLMDEFAANEREARKTLAALGASAPDYDEEDEYAREITQGELGPALLRWDRYSKKHVLERMTEAKSAAYVADVVAFLEDRVRYSRYVDGNHFIYDELQNAAEYLKTHAPAELARIRALPEIGEWVAEIID